MPHLYISTGEVSAEQHAARLVRALRQLAPEIRFTGMGGKGLRAAEVETVVDISRYAVMGFIEVLRHYPAFRRALRTAVDHIEREKPEAVILVDYGGFHLRLAAAIRKRSPETRILYYIVPKVWAWGERRVEKLRACVDHLLCIFPFEEEYFAQRGLSARYVGNPAVDMVRDVDGSGLRRELGLDPEARLVSLFPGSREQEIRRLLPVMLEAVELLRGRNRGSGSGTEVEGQSREAGRGSPGPLAFALAAAPGFSRAGLSRVAPIPASIPVIEGRSLELLAASQLVFAKSGTTTLEAALLGVPMVVVYKGNWLTAALLRRLLKIEHVSLPNIVAQKEIVKELLQADLTAAALAREAAALLEDPERYEKMKRELAGLRGSFGSEPAAERTAQVVIELIHAQ